MPLDETLHIGEDTAPPVREDYQVPFKFTGKLEKVTITARPITNSQTKSSSNTVKEGLLRQWLSR